MTGPYGELVEGPTRQLAGMVDQLHKSEIPIGDQYWWCPDCTEATRSACPAWAWALAQLGQGPRNPAR